MAQKPDETPLGMELADLKRLLKLSKVEPVSCAVGYGSDPKSSFITLEKMAKKQPKGVLAELRKTVGDSVIKHFSWGTAAVDTEVNRKLVTITLEKRLPGIGKRLAKTLKAHKTGYTRVEVWLLGENGDRTEDEDERASEPDEDDIEDETRSSADVPEPNDAPPPPDRSTLAAELAILINMVKALPPELTALRGQAGALLAQAVKQLKEEQFEGVSASAAQLRHILSSASAVEPGGDKTLSSSTKTVDKTTFEKSLRAWDLTKASAVESLNNLLSVMLAEYPDHHGEITAAFNGRIVAPVVDSGLRLSDILAKGVHSADEERAALVKRATSEIDAISSDPVYQKIMADLRDSPFGSVKVEERVDATLKGLRTALG